MDKPKPRHTTFIRRYGNFGFAHPDEKHVSYRFLWAGGDETPDHFNRSFTIKEAYDLNIYPGDCSALELARELAQHYESKYLWSINAKVIKKVVKHLENREERDRLLEAEYAVEEAEYKVDLWQQQLGARRAHLANLKTGQE